MRQPTLFIPHGAGPCFFMEWTRGPADTWGRTWTPSNLGNSAFRLRIADLASSTSNTFYLDYIGVNVTYQP